MMGWHGETSWATWLVMALCMITLWAIMLGVLTAFVVASNRSTRRRGEDHAGDSEFRSPRSADPLGTAPSRTHSEPRLTPDWPRAPLIPGSLSSSEPPVNRASDSGCLGKH